MGIDPGTTTAFAALDTGGRVVAIGSGKSLDRSGLCRRLSSLGSPVIISGDRNPPPSFVERMASTFSARLAVPEENLSRRDKNTLAKELMEGGRKLNQHERDALAAAAFAYNSVKPILMRVGQRLDSLGYHDQEARDFVTARVVLERDHVKRAIEKYRKVIEHD